MYFNSVDSKLLKPKLIKKNGASSRLIASGQKFECDGIDFQLGVLDEQQCKISGTYEGTSVKLGVPDVPKYDFESDKESWGDSGEDNNDDDDADDYIRDDEGLQVQQTEDGIFITQDKYVAEILKKFDFATMKIASTPMEPNKALVKDEEDDSVEIHLYRSMIGSLMYLTASRPDITFAMYTCARDSPFNLEAFLDSDYAGASLDKKSTTGGVMDSKSNA
ncbi:hypothetical protein Tco_1440032 [Tanacetum coccineum]